MHRKLIVIFLLLATTHDALGAPEYDINGVDGLLLDNVRRHITAFSIARQSDVSESDFDSLLVEAVQKARAALRPFGYYNPEINGLVVAPKGAQPIIRLSINRGTPVVIAQADIVIIGEGKERSQVTTWRNTWPLKTGSILDQTVWEERKQFILDQLDAIGYLSADFTEHKIEVDRGSNSAKLVLRLDTGSRFMFGDIDYGEHVLKPGILEFIPRFRKGAAYNRHLLDKFRGDLRKTGYFAENGRAVSN